MKRRLLITLALVAPLLFSTFASGDDNVLTAEEKKEGWQLLFNGSDLTGWKCNNGKPIAAPIENGALVPYKSGFSVQHDSNVDARCSYG